MNNQKKRDSQITERRNDISAKKTKLIPVLLLPFLSRFNDVLLYLFPGKKRKRNSIEDGGSTGKIYQLFSLYIVLHYYTTNKRGGRKFPNFALSFFFSSLPDTGG